MAVLEGKPFSSCSTFYCRGFLFQANLGIILFYCRGFLFQANLGIILSQCQNFKCFKNGHIQKEAISLPTHQSTKHVNGIVQDGLLSKEIQAKINFSEMLGSWFSVLQHCCISLFVYSMYCIVFSVASYFAMQFYCSVNCILFFLLHCLNLCTPLWVLVRKIR